MNVTVYRREVPGAAYRVQAGVTLGTYAAGGVAVAANDFGLTQLHDVEVISPIAGGYLIEYDRTNQKLKAYFMADSPPIEVQGGTDLSSIVAQVTAVGT